MGGQASSEISSQILYQLEPAKLSFLGILSPRNKASQHTSSRIFYAY